MTYPQTFVIVGANAAGLALAADAAADGFSPVIVDGGAGLPAPRRRAALADRGAIFLTHRTARSVWGDLDAGLNLETDTGETITGARIAFAVESAAEAEALSNTVTGLSPVADARTGETAVPGVYVKTPPAALAAAR